MKGAILSFLALLVAVNADVHKEKTVTTQEIHQLMSDMFDSLYKGYEGENPFKDPPLDSMLFNLKSDDVDLTMNLTNEKIHMGELESKSVATNVTDSAVAAGFAFYVKGYNISCQHATNGTVQGKAYNLNGDLAFRFNYEGKSTFGASYDNKSVTFESIDYDSHVTNPSIELTGLPFDGIVQKKIISLVTDEFVKKLGEIQKPFKERPKGIIKDLNEINARQTVKKVYDKYRRYFPTPKN